MITVYQINLLRDHGITSLELLSVLLATENEIRIDDLCDLAGICRRTLEKMIKDKKHLLERKTRLELITGLPGAPRTKVINRTERATEILKNLDFIL